MELKNGVPSSLFDLIISDSFVQNGVDNYKKSLLFSKTESTSKTESNIIFCMIAKIVTLISWSISALIYQQNI